MSGDARSRSHLVVRWGRHGYGALLAVDRALATSVALRLSPGGLVDDDSPPLSAVVVARSQAASLSLEHLAEVRLAVLLDPTMDDRARVMRALGGRRTTRLVEIPLRSTIATAEHTVLLALALARRLFHAYAAVVSGEGVAPVRAEASDPAFDGAGLGSTPLLYGKTLGVLGMGRVGTAVSERARGLGMQVIYHDVRAAVEAELRLGLIRRRFDQLLREADVVSLHLPLTPETRRIIDAPELALMKPDAYLINTAHGGLTDEGALIKALRSGAIAGAGLDVFAFEPLASDSPLLGLPNVVLTPHGAGIPADDEREHQACRVAEELGRLEP
jgi:phosphoglycerate dehydrogenase-like enzyme